MQETVEGDFDGLEVMLDYRVVDPSVSFNSGDSYITLPYQPLNGEEYVAVLTQDGVDRAGTAYPCSIQPDGTVAAVGVDLSNQALMVGKKYSFEYQLSPIYMRDQGKVPIQDGRLQIRYLSILYHQTSYFRVLVTPPGRTTYTAIFAGRVFGRLSNIIGGVAVEDGEFRVPISTESSRMDVRIVNDSPFNSRFSSIDWEGTWRPKNRRMR